MLINNNEITNIWNQFLKKRLVSVSTSGGRYGQQIWILIDGKRVQARCFGNLQRGECLAAQLDSGEWLLVDAQVAKIPQGSSRNIELRRITKKRKKELLLKSIVWNTGYTKNESPGVADLSTTFFSGKIENSKKKGVSIISNDEIMPNLRGIRLLYIPMIGRSLSSDEITRLQKFRDSGGIIFVTGEHANFSLERVKANEIMASLGSPLRCVDINESFGVLGGGLYPTTFENLSELYGNASCRVTGGISISTIPESVYTPGSNITWIAYHEETKTVLSGDVDWASTNTPGFFYANQDQFAKLLLTL